MHEACNILPSRAVAICFTVISLQVSALTIPSLSSSSAYDEFRTSSGMSCRQSISGKAQLQIGGITSKDDSENSNYGVNWNRGDYHQDESGIFIQLVIPIGTPDRIDCTTLYNLEIEKQALELSQLKAQIELLKKQAALAGLENLPEL